MTTADLIARLNAAVDLAKSQRDANGGASQAVVGRLLVSAVDILGDLIVLVDAHQRQPFTKAHDKGSGE
jgi:hypothetical protein